MEIKQFKEISPLQKKELYNFIKGMDLTYNKTYIEMIKIYESDTFNDGHSVFILFNNCEIMGSIAVITKEIIIKGEAYITDIYIEKKGENNENIYLNNPFKVINIENFSRILIEKGVEYCNIRGAKSVKIGIRESETHLIPYMKKFKFTHIYDAQVMTCNKEENIVSKVNNDMELIPLSISNSHQYINIQNETFKNSPNGGTIDEAEVRDYIVRYANNEDLIGLCFAQKKACGIYELSIDRNVGWIDTLGIMPKYQNKGLGKQLLGKCIEKLYEKKLDEIKLLVITSNQGAVSMYRNYGFEDEKVFSYWFEKVLGNK